MAASTKKTKKNKENKEIPNMKNKSKEYKILLLYDILATSDCLCSASPAYNTILQLHPNKNSNNLLTGCIEAGNKWNQFTEAILLESKAIPTQFVAQNMMAFN